MFLIFFATICPFCTSYLSENGITLSNKYRILKKLQEKINFLREVSIPLNTHVIIVYIHGRRTAIIL